MKGLELGPGGALHVTSLCDPPGLALFNSPVPGVSGNFCLRDGRRPCLAVCCGCGAGDKSSGHLHRKGHLMVCVPQNSRADSCIRHSSGAQLLGEAAFHSGCQLGFLLGLLRCQAGSRLWLGAPPFASKGSCRKGPPGTSSLQQVPHVHSDWSALCPVSQSPWPRAMLIG